MLLYDNHFVHEDELRLPLTNRAFQYNDGFFETIIIRQGSLSFWEMHLERMQEAAQALKLQLPGLFFSKDFEGRLLELATQQQALAYGRLKLKMWRAGAGIYTPETNEVGWMATAQPADPIYNTPLQVGVCRQTRTLYSPLSHFKGPNAPLYVLAGLEKTASAKGDMLILDLQGNVAEFVAANVFWIKEEAIHTPPLTTGCINGVLRRSIFKWCHEKRVPIVESLESVKHLQQADIVFAANVTGIRTIGHIEEASLPAQHLLLEQLQKDLFS